MSPNANIIGTWRLVAVQNKRSDGQIYLPYGQEIDGYITYTAQGRMSVLLRTGAKDSPNRIFSAYAGPYEFDGDRVVHHVTIASDPRREGVDLVRGLRFDGNRIMLTPVDPPPWMKPDEAGEITTLIWERLESDG